MCSQKIIICIHLSTPACVQDLPTYTWYSSGTSTSNPGTISTEYHKHPEPSRNTSIWTVGPCARSFSSSQRPRALMDICIWGWNLLCILRGDKYTSSIWKVSDIRVSNYLCRHIPFLQARWDSQTPCHSLWSWLPHRNYPGKWTSWLYTVPSCASKGRQQVF